MHSDFDPYGEWLQIADDRRPPSEYDLLGLAPADANAETVHAAVLARSALVRKYCLGPRGAVATRVLGELAAAKNAISMQLETRGGDGMSGTFHEEEAVARDEAIAAAVETMAIETVAEGTFAGETIAEETAAESTLVTPAPATGPAATPMGQSSDDEATIRREITRVRACRRPILREIARHKRLLAGVHVRAGLLGGMLTYLRMANLSRRLAERLIGWRFGMVIVYSALLLIFTFFCEIVLGYGLPALALAAIGIVFIILLHYAPNDAAIVEQTSTFTADRDQILDKKVEHLRALEPLKAQDKQLAAQEADLKARAVRACKQWQSRQLHLSLAQRPWKAYRSVEFEQFLKEVFEALGGAVETTKVIGDQGAVLIVTLARSRFAIQAKGDDNSVGNSAVQQAFAAMTIYGCHRCMVITNSRFTTPAMAAAQTTGCILIDEHSLPDLILGKLSLC